MNILLKILLVVLCASCTNKDWDVDSTQEVMVYGNQIDESMTNSRGSTTGLLNNGTKISFYAQGGILADGETMTLENDVWQRVQPLYWTNMQIPASVCAYTPPLPKSVQELYQTDGKLMDILIAQKSYTYKEPIHLKFQHLFSQINFQLEEELNSQLKELILTPHKVISGITPATSESTMAAINQNEKEQYSVKYTRNDKGVYSLLLPPSNDQGIDVLIRTQDNRVLRKVLSPINIARNQAYNCNVKEKTTIAGISTAEDFIAFTHLINQYSYGNRTLKEFETIVNGRKTYSLLNDIDLSNVKPGLIQQIGQRTNIDFCDVFDGKGFCISGLPLVSDVAKDEGLFAKISSDGVVKNLTLRSASIKFDKKGYSQGVICGYNHGIIENCHVKNCIMASPKKTNGGIAGKNSGYIVNCSIDEFTFKSLISKEENITIQFGGISYSNHATGIILNCKIYNLQRGNDRLKLKEISAITNSNEGVLSNCLVENTSPLYHPFCRIGEIKADHCYFPSAMGKHVQLSNKECTERSIYIFSKPETKKTITNMLNDWTDKIGKTKYPQFKFRTWKLNANNDIDFE